MVYYTLKYITKTKKSQADIIGFVIIVILIIIGVIFMIFINKNNDLDNKMDITDSQLSQSVLNVISRTKTSCGTKLTNVIADCFEGKSICGVDSCDFASDELTPILKDSLIIWGKSFHLYATQDDIDKINLYNGKCDKTSEKNSPGYIFIHNDENVIVLSLDICKN
jgi:hypothetical protein